MQLGRKAESWGSQWFGCERLAKRILSAGWRYWMYILQHAEINEAYLAFVNSKIIPNVLHYLKFDHILYHKIYCMGKLLCNYNVLQCRLPAWRVAMVKWLKFLSILHNTSASNLSWFKSKSEEWLGNSSQFTMGKFKETNGEKMGTTLHISCPNKKVIPTAPTAVQLFKEYNADLKC